MLSRGLSNPVRAGARKSFVLFWTALFVCSLLLQYVVIAGPVLGAVSDSGTYSVVVPDHTSSRDAVTSGGALVTYIGDSASNGSSGTGIFDPFVRLQGSPTEQAYNTNGTKEFDTKTGTWTHAILVSDIPVVTIGGKNYWELFNDINETNSTAYVSLNKVEAYFTSNANLTGYSAGFGSNATLQYAFDGAILIHDVNSGSGRADLRYRIPTAGISIPSDCGYLSSGCSTYFVLYSEWGTTGTYTDGNDYSSDGGFEEWKTQQKYATLQIVKHTVGGDGTFGFSVTGTPSAPPVAHPSITTSGGTGATQNWIVSPGTYKITEDSLPASWQLSGATCSLNGGSSTSYTPGSNLVLGATDHEVCTFTNAYVAPGLAITKGVSLTNGSGYGPSLTTTVGTTVYYRIHVSNTGNVGLTGVTLTDNLFDLVGKGCSIPTTLDVGDSFNCDYSDTAKVGSTTNTATADSNETPSVDDSATVNVDAAPGLAITKGVSLTNGSGYGPSLTTTVGTTVYYRIHVSNTGNVGLTGVTLTDNLFDLVGKGCSIPTTLDVGDSFNCDYSDTAKVGSTTNTATADSNETPSVDDSATVNVDAAPGLAITKGVSLTNGSGYGPSLTTTVGTTVYYRIHVSNTGNVGLTGVTLTDNLFDLVGKGCSIPTTLDVGDSFNCDYSDTAKVGSTTNTATADSNETPSVDDSATVNGQAPVLNLVKEVSVNGGAFSHSGSANPGDTLTYRLTITNTGDAAATGESVTDNLSSVLAHATWNDNASASSGSASFANPNLTWSGISIAADGGTATLTFSVTLASVFPDGTTHLPNTAVEANSENCPSATSENPDCSTDTTVTATPALDYLKLVSTSANGPFVASNSANPGDTLYYKITVSNSGNAGATNQTVTDVLSSALVANSAAFDISTCNVTCSYDAGSRTITWTGVDIDAGGSATLTFRVMLNGTFPSGQTQLDNSVVCPLVNNEPNPDCTTTTIVNAAPVLNLVKEVSVNGGAFSHSGSANPGDTLTYQPHDHEHRRRSRDRRVGYRQPVERPCPRNLE